MDAEEIDTLNRITVMFLDQAEFRAQRRRDIRMRDWEGFLEKFLRDTDLPVLSDTGSVSHEEALCWAHDQYDAFSERRRLKAEAEAEAQYVENLRGSANTLEHQRKQLPSKKKKLTGGRVKNGKREPDKGGER